MSKGRCTDEIALVIILCVSLDTFGPNSICILNLPETLDDDF